MNGGETKMATAETVGIMQTLRERCEAYFQQARIAKQCILRQDQHTGDEVVETPSGIRIERGRNGNTMTISSENKIDREVVVEHVMFRGKGETPPEVFGSIDNDEGWGRVVALDDPAALAARLLELLPEAS